MNDQNTMEALLLNAKGTCDLYMHGTIESGTPVVHEAFCQALNCTLDAQAKLYEAMAHKGWYPTQQAPESQQELVKKKFAPRGYCDC